MTPLRVSPFILSAAIAGLIAMPAFAEGNLRHSLTPLKEEPVISVVQGRKVRVKVPAGYSAVTLQRKTTQKKTPWATVSSTDVGGEEKEVVFTLRNKLSKRSLRVLGKVKSSLPDSFLKGPTNFLGESTVNTPVATGSSSGAVNTYASGSSFASTGSLSISTGSSADSASSSIRAVTESDIWKLDGDRLFFFNQYRGLQNIDVSNTAKPALLGTLRMPGVGEDLYQLDSTHIVLLKRTPKELGWTSGSTTIDAADQSGEIVVCDTSTDEPTIVARLPFTGSIANSRLIGNALIVAKNVPKTGVSGGYSWSTDLEVTGYDLSNPAAPVERNTVSFPSDSYAWTTAVQSSNRCFMVAQQAYDSAWYTVKSNIQLVDVSSADGTVVKGGTASAPGYVPDKFKMHEANGVMSVVSAVPTSWWRDRGQTQHAHLENFDVSDITTPVSIGSIVVGENESTRAVRFDGDRVYIVTVVQQDPLWIIDNADPANPTLTGELHVPGFSSYIEPLGDRLVTVGRVWGDDGSGNWQNRVTVSLYDVADPANPAQLSQLPVGEAYSYSAAEWDDKAFTVIPDANLIMLPYSSGWSWWGNNSTGGVQLVDLQRDSLALRGVIHHGFTPQRTALKGDTVLALSQTDLLTVDIADRDNPVVKADVELAWNVSRVWTAGKSLLQLGKRISDNTNIISVSSRENAEDTIGSLEIGTDPVDAAELKGDLLYVVQTSTDPKTYARTQALSVFSVASLPQIVKLGTSKSTDALSYGQTSLLFPTDTTAVIARKQSNYWFWGGPLILNDGVSLTLNRPLAAAPTATLAVIKPDPVPVTFSVSGAVSGSSISLSGSSITSTTQIRPGLSAGVLTLAGGTIQTNRAQPLRTPRTSAPRTTTQDTFLTIPEFYYGNPGGTLTLTAFDVSNPRTPKALDTTTLSPENASQFSDIFTSSGKVFVSHYTGYRYYYWAVDAADSDDSADTRNRYFLNVVDFSSPEAPKVSEPVSFPGELRSVARDGGILYAKGPGYDDAGTLVSTDEFLHAVGFDGAAHLIDSIPLGARWSYDDIRFANGNVFVNNTTYDATTQTSSTSLSAWTLGEDAKFTLRDTLDAAPLGDWTIAGDTLIYSNGETRLGLINVANPADLQSISNYLDRSNAWSSSVKNIAGDIATGFWIPEGNFGVRFIAPPQ